MRKTMILVLLVSLTLSALFGIIWTGSVSASSDQPGWSSPANRSLPTDLGFSQTEYSVREESGTATITVTLTAAGVVTTTVGYATADGTAIAGSDYTAVSGTLTFSLGITTQTFTIPILDDDLTEGNETIQLTLEDLSDGTLLLDTATLTILDDENDLFLPLVMRSWPAIPDPPTLNLIDNTDGDGAYTVTWLAVAEADGYILEEATNNAFSDAQMVYQGSDTTFDVSGKGLGTYYYRVKATNLWVASAWSNIQTAAVLPPPAAFAGSNPSVSFELTADNRVCNFEMTIPFRDTSCRLRAKTGVCYELTDNRFTIPVGLPDDYITGNFNGQNRFDGDYHVALCGNTLIIPAETGAWQATRQ